MVNLHHNLLAYGVVASAVTGAGAVAVAGAGIVAVAMVVAVAVPGAVAGAGAVAVPGPGPGLVAVAGAVAVSWAGACGGHGLALGGWLSGCVYVNVPTHPPKYSLALLIRRQVVAHHLYRVGIK